MSRQLDRWDLDRGDRGSEAKTTAVPGALAKMRELAMKELAEEIDSGEEEESKAGAE